MLQEIKELSYLIGQINWGNWHDTQAGTGFNFGIPELKIWEKQNVAYPKWRWRRAYPVGQYRIHFYLSFWKLEIEDEELVTIESELTKINIALHRLEGQKLEKVEYDNENGKTVFAFDLGAILTCERFPDYQPEDQLWSFTDNKINLYVTASGKIDKLGK